MIECKVGNLEVAVEELQSKINDNTEKVTRESAKVLGIRRFSVMKKEELLKVLEEVEKEVYYKSLHCYQCLREQQKQRIIDEQTYNEKAMVNVIRQLVCEYCKHEDFTVDGDLEVCRYWGVIREEARRRLWEP